MPGSGLCASTCIVLLCALALGWSVVPVCGSHSPRRQVNRTFFGYGTPRCRLGRGPSPVGAELVGEAEERAVELDRRQGAAVEDKDLGRQAVSVRIAPEALDG